MGQNDPGNLRILPRLCHQSCERVEFGERYRRGIQLRGIVDSDRFGRAATLNKRFRVKRRHAGSGRVGRARDGAAGGDHKNEVTHACQCA